MPDWYIFIPLLNTSWNCGTHYYMGKGMTILTVALVGNIFSLYLGEWFSYPSTFQDHLQSLLKQIAGACLQSFWSSRFGMGPRICTFNEFTSWCIWIQFHTLKTTGFQIDCLMFSFTSTPFSEPMEKRRSPPKQHTHSSDTHTLSHTCTHVPPMSLAWSFVTTQEEPSLFHMELLKRGCDSSVLLVPP